MECNRDEAARAKEIADTKLGNQDIPGAKKFALKAQCLYPQLDGLSQLMATIDMFVSAENKVGGEVDWYGVLGVSPVAEDETVKKQYKKLALVLHPDKNKSPGADDAFKLISEAWSLLSDKSKRLAYNQRRFPRGFTQSSPIRTNSSPTAHQHRQQQNSNNHAPAAAGSSFPAGGNAKNTNNHAPAGSAFPAGRKNAKNSNNHAPVGSAFPAERNAKNSNNHAPAASSFPAGGNAKNSNNHAPAGSSFPSGRKNAKNSNNHAPAGSSFPAGRKNAKNSNNHAPAGSSFPARRNAKNSNNHVPTGNSFPAGRNAQNSNNHAPAGRNADSAPKSSGPGPAGVHSVKHPTRVWIPKIV